MNTTTKTIIAVALAASLGLAACGDSEGDNNGANNGGDTATLTLQSDGVPALGDGYVWEGWLVTSDGPQTTGRFNLEDGKSEYSFDVSSELASSATKFVLTIEPAEGDDPAPADTKFLAADLTDGAGTATIDTAPALGTDFSSAAGSYILAAPTGDNASYTNGLWFLDNSGQSPVASLTLPELPAGWAYEGWVVKDGPVSTGTFTAADMADSDMGGPYAGPNDAPPFPGQDFVSDGNERDLTDGHMVVISVEPQPDDSPMPFTLKPLVDDSVEDVGMGGSQDLSNTAGDFPTMSVSVQ
jgi:hypothetical protein